MTSVHFVVCIQTNIVVSNIFCISGTSYRNESIRGAFGDALKEMDASIGVLIDHLTEIGELNNTMVIFTSDNG